VTEKRGANPTGHGDVRHESRDVDPRAVVRAIALVSLVTVVTAGVVVILLRVLAAREARQFPSPPPMARQEPDRRPPEPRLQESPVVDVEQLRKEEEELLTTYGWIDHEAGIIHIHIDRAIDLLVERGLPRVPSRPAGAPPVVPEAKR